MELRAIPKVKTRSYFLAIPKGLEQNNGSIAADVEQQPAKDENTSIPGTESKSTPGFEIGCGVVSLLGIFLYRRR